MPITIQYGPPPGLVGLAAFDAARRRIEQQNLDRAAAMGQRNRALSAELYSDQARNQMRIYLAQLQAAERLAGGEQDIRRAGMGYQTQLALSQQKLQWEAQEPQRKQAEIQQKIRQLRQSVAMGQIDPMQGQAMEKALMDQLAGLDPDAQRKQLDEQWGEIQKRAQQSQVQQLESWMRTVAALQAGMYSQYNDAERQKILGSYQARIQALKDQILKQPDRSGPTLEEQVKTEVVNDPNMPGVQWTRDRSGALKRWDPPKQDADPAAKAQQKAQEMHQKAMQDYPAKVEEARRKHDEEQLKREEKRMAYAAKMYSIQETVVQREKDADGNAVEKNIKKPMYDWGYCLQEAWRTYPDLPPFQPPPPPTPPTQPPVPQGPMNTDQLNQAVAGPGMSPQPPNLQMPGGALPEGMGPASPAGPADLQQQMIRDAGQQPAPDMTPTEQLPLVTSQAQYDALPAGALYRGRDGKIHRKA